MRVMVLWGTSFLCPQVWGRCVWAPGDTPCLGDPEPVLPSLDYNHPFMLLGRVGTQSRLQALVTCGLVPACSSGCSMGVSISGWPSKAQSRLLASSHPEAALGSNNASLSLSFPFCKAGATCL